MMDYRTIACELGELVTQKDRAYGSSVASAGQVLAIYYPHGVRPEQYGDMLLMARVLDKLSRIATDRDALGESPWRDIAGYGLIGAALAEGRPAPMEKTPEPAPPKKPAATPKKPAPKKRTPDLAFARALDAAIDEARRSGTSLTRDGVRELAARYGRDRSAPNKALKVRVATGRLVRRGDLYYPGGTGGEGQGASVVSPESPAPLSGPDLVQSLREAVSVESANRAALASYEDRGLPVPDGAPAPAHMEPEPDVDVQVTRRADVPALAPAVPAATGTDPAPTSSEPQGPAPTRPPATTATTDTARTGREALTAHMTQLVRENGQVSRAQMVAAAQKRGLSAGLADAVIKDAADSGLLTRVEPGIYAPPGPVLRPAATENVTGPPRVTLKTPPKPAPKPASARFPVGSQRLGPPDPETVAEWRRMLAMGKSYAHIAGAYERSVKDVHAAITESERADIEAAVRAGNVQRLPGAGTPELGALERARRTP